MNNVTKLKQPFTPQMEDMVRHAKAIKPSIMLIALMSGPEEDRKVYCDWSMATCSDLAAIRALIDNQIEQAMFRENTKYSFVPIEFYEKWPDGSDDPEDRA